jgi:hypothetical protein
MGLSLAALVALLAASQCRADEAEARKIADKAIQAAGGQAALTKYKAAAWKGKGTFYGLGDGVPYTGEWYIQGNDQFKMDIAGTFILVVNRDQGWIVEGGTPRELTKDEMAEQKESMYASVVIHRLPLKEQGFTLTTLGEEKVGDRPAVGLKVSHAGHRDISLYFDKDTHLVVKAAFKVKARDQGDKEVMQETYFSDYKEVNGTKMAAKEVIKRDGKNFVDGESFEVKLLDKLDDKVFSKP